MGKTIRYNGETVKMHRASAIALEKRHGRHSGQTHKDRRQSRGGNRNEQREYLEDIEAGDSDYVDHRRWR